MGLNSLHGRKSFVPISSQQDQQVQRSVTCEDHSYNNNNNNTAGRLHSSTNAYMFPSSALTHMLFMALLALSMTSSKTSHPRTKLSLFF